MPENLNNNPAEEKTSQGLQTINKYIDYTNLFYIWNII